MWAVIIGIIATIVLGLSGLVGSHGHRSASIWLFYLSAITYLFLAFKAYDEAGKSPAESLPTTTLDKPTPPPVTKPKPSAAPAATFPAIASPSTTPITTQTLDPPLPSIAPAHRVAALTLGDVLDKLSKAINSSDSGEYQEVRNALRGLRVDWTMNFYSANRDSSGELMHVWLHDRTRITGLVNFTLPLVGNERFPLMEKTDVFRVRGLIDDARAMGITLREATVEYVRSDPKK